MTKEKKSLEIIEIAISFFAGIVVAGIATFAAFKANDISMMNTAPYFSISPIVESGKQTGYLINNDGGYIQNASVTLKNYILVQVRISGEIFYFPYETIIRNYSDLEDNEIIIEFDDFSFGISNWNNGLYDIPSNIVQNLDFRNIDSYVYYVELLELRYLDINREVKNEQYFIVLNDETISISLATDEHIDNIDIHTYSDVRGTVVDIDELATIQVGHSGTGGAGREFGRSTVFVSSVVDVIEEHIRDLLNNLSE